MNSLGIWASVASIISAIVSVFSLIQTKSIENRINIKIKGDGNITSGSGDIKIGK